MAEKKQNKKTEKPPLEEEKAATPDEVSDAVARVHALDSRIGLQGERMYGGFDLRITALDMAQNGMEFDSPASDILAKAEQYYRFLMTGTDPTFSGATGQAQSQAQA